MQLAVKLDWGMWVYGLAAAFIGGGASSLTAGISAIGVDPEHFNLGASQHGLRHVMTLMGVTFLVSGLFHAMSFLAQKPLPDKSVNSTSRAA